jgi:hypothetical protein|tara:strand:- start:161 stop:370 length:210 start_codon:yes stop_codon:yes gene_type:complete
MTELLSAIGGLAVGIIGTTLYLGKEIKELKNIILDKRTIVNLLKQALRENKPKRTYKRNGYKGKKTAKA